MSKTVIMSPAKITKRGKYTLGITIPADVCHDADLHPLQLVKVTIEPLEPEYHI